MSGRGRPSRGCERCRHRKVKVPQTTSRCLAVSCILATITSHPPISCYEGSRWSMLVSVFSTHPSPLHGMTVKQLQIPSFANNMQCDETLPSCRRCQKSNHECTYRDEFDRVHRDQVSWAAKQAQGKWRGRALKGLELASSSPSSSDDETSTELIRGLFCPLMNAGPTKALQPTLGQQAFLRFYYDFVSPMDMRGPEMSPLDSLPRLYSTSSPDSCLHSATVAVSFANFGSRFKFIEARKVGAEHYGRALRLAAAAADNPAMMQSKQTILAVYLLALYEASLPNHQPLP